MRDHFTTGEFAKLCRVKKQTLFHYDDIGILSPDIVARNGYRYYSYKQLETFYMIATLKELDMPLKEIREYMDKRSPENFVRLLEAQAVKAEDSIRKLQYMSSYINKKLQITKEAIVIEKEKIHIEEQPKEHFIITEYSGSNEDEDIDKAITRHFNYCKELGIQSAYGIGGMIETENIRRKNEYRYAYFYTRTEKLSVPGFFSKPRGEYLTYYDPNGYSKIEETAAKLISYAKEKGRRAGKYFYEELALDGLSSKRLYDYTIKLSLQIK